MKKPVSFLKCGVRFPTTDGCRVQPVIRCSRIDLAEYITERRSFFVFVFVVRNEVMHSSACDIVRRRRASDIPDERAFVGDLVDAAAVLVVELGNANQRLLKAKFLLETENMIRDAMETVRGASANGVPDEAGPDNPRE